MRANRCAAVRAPEAHGLVRVHATRWNVSKILIDIFYFKDFHKWLTK